jgi:hypothetical protein
MAGDKFVGVHAGDPLRVAVAETLRDRPRTSECPLHRHLLIEQHADEECGAIATQ